MILSFFYHDVIRAYALLNDTTLAFTAILVYLVLMCKHMQPFIGMKVIKDGKLLFTRFDNKLQGGGGGGWLVVKAKRAI
jgi:hypothetical protein